MRRIAKLLLWIFLVMIFVGLVFHKDKLLPKPPKPTLKSVAEQSMSDSQGRYGIYIKNFKTGEKYTLREGETFDSGSLYKLWVMKKVFEQIKTGKLKEDDILSSSIAALNQRYNIASGEAELTSGSLNISVKNALTQMITISHNYAAMLLLSTVGNSDVPTQTTPQDVVDLLEKIYKGELVDPESSSKMIDLLSKQQINDRIPKLLPEGTKVAHKTADLGFFEHDAGIVFSETGDYLIVVLSESEFPAAADERIASLSEAVYKYFNIVEK
ncbi:serine hydrolase [Candidatus Daviesbacteria bacterium]|nr:serine hydrolase [Candidatus Daviesbacteria bacterium]